MEEYYRIIRFIFKNANPDALEYGINLAKNVLIILGIIIGIIIIISLYKIFKKTGRKGYIAFIPIYNLIVLYKISGINPLFLLTFFIMFIPGFGVFGFIIWNIIDATQKGLLVRKFGKSIWYVVGIILFDYIFYPILAFGKSKYKIENNKEVEEGE